MIYPGSMRFSQTRNSRAKIQEVVHDSIGIVPGPDGKISLSKRRICQPVGSKVRNSSCYTFPLNSHSHRDGDSHVSSREMIHSPGAGGSKNKAPLLVARFQYVRLQ